MMLRQLLVSLATPGSLEFIMAQLRVLLLHDIIGCNLYPQGENANESVTKLANISFMWDVSRRIMSLFLSFSLSFQPAELLRLVASS